MNTRVQLTDELLQAALAARMRHAPSQALFERIMASLGTAQQERAPGGWLAGVAPRRLRIPLPALAGAVAAVLAIALAVTLLQPPLGPAGTPAPSPPAKTVPAPTAQAVTLATGQSAVRIALGPNTRPNDVVDAFGSIWTADMGANDVRRFEPGTMRELARIEVQGAAWFVVADDALWVSQEAGTGLTRIDPATNRAVAHVGGVRPCGAPAVAFENIWVSACDADEYLRIDPVTTTVADVIPAQGHRSEVLVGDALITMGAEGLARLDPATRAFTAVPGSPGAGAEIIGSDGETVWLAAGTEAQRVDPTNGRIVASFRYQTPRHVTFSGSHAWLAANPLVIVVEIDLSTNTDLRSFQLPQSADVAREADGVVWVIDSANNTLWRVQP
jgi:streptogramin lyase